MSVVKTYISGRRPILALVALTALALAGCQSTAALKSGTLSDAKARNYTYLIGPGDGLGIFVWRNPDLSTHVTVRPDGKISVPLVSDLQAAGKTPTQLAKEIEKSLSAYIKEPLVTVMVDRFNGLYSTQVRVVGQAVKPQALPYRTGMTVLDVMIAVGGLTEFADGNDARLIRTIHGKQYEERLRLASLLQDGDIKANVPVAPGDIIIIPESWF